VCVFVRVCRYISEVSSTGFVLYARLFVQGCFGGYLRVFCRYVWLFMQDPFADV